MGRDHRCERRMERWEQRDDDGLVWTEYRLAWMGRSENSNSHDVASGGNRDVWRLRFCFALDGDRDGLEAQTQLARGTAFETRSMVAPNFLHTPLLAEILPS